MKIAEVLNQKKFGCFQILHFLFGNYQQVINQLTTQLATTQPSPSPLTTPHITKPPMSITTKAFLSLAAVACQQPSIWTDFLSHCSQLTAEALEKLVFIFFSSPQLLTERAEPRVIMMTSSLMWVPRMCLKNLNPQNSQSSSSVNREKRERNKKTNWRPTNHMDSADYSVEPSSLVYMHETNGKTVKNYLVVSGGVCGRKNQ